MQRWLSVAGLKPRKALATFLLKEHFVLALFIQCPYLTIISPVEWRSIRSVGRAIGWCHKIFIFAVEASFYKENYEKIAYLRLNRRDSYFNVVENEVVGTDVDDVELSLFLNIAKRLGFNVGYL